MSMFQVAFTRIKALNPHPKEDVHSLEIATIYDFQVVVKKGIYNEGDFVCFCPIDSVLPQDLEALIFPEGSKIKLNNSRIKQIRIQKFPSQGMIIDVSVVKQYIESKGVKFESKLEVDIAPLLGITKYEPPLPEFQKVRSQTRKEKPLENPLFHKFNGLENIKWYGEMFKEGEEVVVQEKIHGSNCRLGYLKTVKPKIQHILNELKLFNMRGALVLAVKFVKMSLTKETTYEHCYGSNNVELTNRDGDKNFYGENVYYNVLKKVDAFNKIQPNEIIYGELIGAGIQVNYDYGHKNDHHFVLFDVKVLDGENTRWLNPGEVIEYADSRGFDMVPELYRGSFNKQAVYELTKGASVYCPAQKVREGIVIKAVEYNNKACPGNKKCLKWISEAYLDKEQSDNH